MTTPLRPRAAFVFMCLMAALPCTASAQARPRPLDHDAYERWKALREEVLSPDGDFVAYVLTTPGESGRLRVRALPHGPDLEIPGGHDPQFTQDSRFLAVTIDPRGSGSSGPHAPDTLAVVDLERWRVDGVSASTVTRTPGLIDVQVAARERSEIAYRLSTGSAERVLVMRDLVSPDERRVRDVGEYRLSRDGSTLWYMHADGRGNADGVFRMETATGAATPVFVEKGAYAGLTLSPDGSRAAFLFSPQTSAAPEWQLEVALKSGVRAVVSAGAPELARDWSVRADAPLRFSASGTRLYFAAAPPQATLASADVDPEVSVDVWSWSDPYLQPMQIAQARRERERSYRWVAHLVGGEVVQLEEPGGPTLRDPRTGDEPALVAIDDEPYRQLLSWDARYVDVYLIDPQTGERTRAIKRVRGDAKLSPSGRWITWWDGDARQWRGLETATRRTTSLTGLVPFPVHDEANDRPGPPEAYGLAGWTEGDERALVYDRFDVWSVDPAGVLQPVNVTSGAGRAGGIRFRLASVEGGPDVAPPATQQILPAHGQLLLSALDLKTRDAGFWSDRIEGGETKPLLMSPHHYGVPARAAAGDRILFTRESFAEYPDLWTANGQLGELARVSNANPQQNEFRWGSEGLVSWTSRDGRPLHGIVYKPQDFDPKRRYPVVVQLYERATDDFHRYHDPAPEAASINRSFYVSRGYVVFAPDIAYRVGEPGASLVDAVVPGVQSLIDGGIADANRIGVQGHSWGGWEVAYLLTRTEIFAAAIAGAPVANMTSAYGGVRWGSGMSRMFQYEQEQSRIGATLWETPERYIENSPLFAADKIRTPLLVLHNDEDDSVPFEQGIELFSALRRLGKPAWMVNYNGEMHALRRSANRRDWAIRMQQFFDHYLLGTPPAVWMAQGIPATKKGQTLGLDLVEPQGTPMTNAGISPGEPSGRTPARATSRGPVAPSPRP